MTKKVQRRNELAKETSKQVKSLAADQEKLWTEVIQQRAHDQEKIAGFQTELANFDIKLAEHKSLTELVISEKVSEMEKKLLDQFKGIHFSSNNQPAPKDVFTMKMYYNMSKNAIGLYPIEPSDLDMIAQQTPGIQRRDM